MPDTALPSIEQLNHNTLFVRLALTSSPESARQVAACRTSLLREYGHRLRNTVPASTTLLLEFVEPITRFTSLQRRLQKLIGDINTELPDILQPGQLHRIPVLYHADVGPDLAALAAFHRLSEEEVIHIHSTTLYTVYAIGFLPGFAYLGDVDQRIATPRQHSPRAQIPPCSVGIAEAQTGIYPSCSPGGWNIIGRSAWNPLNPITAATSNGLCRLAVGDCVQFRAVSATEFNTLCGQSPR